MVSTRTRRKWPGARRNRCRGGCAQRATHRAGLLVGLPPVFVTSLPHATAPGEQILTDLDALSAATALTDGTVPLAVWLRNAIALTGTRKEAATFERILEHVQAAVDTDSGSAAPPNVKLKMALKRTASTPLPDAKLPSFQFVSVNADPAEIHWSPVPVSGVFSDAYPDVPYAFHKTLLIESDPTIDVTVINNRREPMVLTHVGVRIVSMALRVRVAGVSHPARILQTESYAIDIPNIFFDYVPPERRRMMSYGPLEIGKDIWTTPTHLVSIPKQEPFRYGLLLKNFDSHLPNFCCIKLLTKTNHGQHESALIEMFSW